MRQQKQVVLFDEEQYGGGWPPRNATEYIAWFTEKLECIPAEYRATASIDIDSVSSYEDSHYARIQITYIRPETDEEVVIREAQEQAREAARKAFDLKQLAALKEKYGA